MRLPRGDFLGHLRRDCKFAGVSEVEILHREKLLEELLVRFAVFLEVLPAARDIGSRMEDDGPLIERMIGAVLFDDAHDPAHELHER